MHLTFFTSPKARRLAFTEKFATGARRHGDTIELVPIGQRPDRCPDVAVIIGNKLRHHAVGGCPVLILDKGYSIPVNGGFPRSPFVRATINDTHPVAFLTRLGMPSDRRIAFGWRPSNWREHGHHVLLAGASSSFYKNNRIDQDQYLGELAAQIGRYTQREVILRHKRKVAGVLPPPSEHLTNCHVLVVENSSIAFQALIMGVPAVVLGDAPTAPISSQSLEDVEYPRLALLSQRYALLNDLAYFQYSETEYESGRAWDFLRPLLGGKHAASGSGRSGVLEGHGALPG